MMFKEFQLPDGTIAESSQDVDRYLKESGSAWAGDYSGEFYKNRRHLLEKEQNQTLVDAFIRNYKKEIWK